MFTLESKWKFALNSLQTLFLSLYILVQLNFFVMQYARKKRKNPTQSFEVTFAGFLFPAHFLFLFQGKVFLGKNNSKLQQFSYKSTTSANDGVKKDTFSCAINFQRTGEKKEESRSFCLEYNTHLFAARSTKLPLVRGNVFFSFA